MPKRLLGSIVALVVVIVLAVLTNPSPERHRARIAEAIAQRSPLAKVLGVGALTAFVSNYHSLGVASYTKAGDRVVSYGFLGMVFVADSD